MFAYCSCICSSSNYVTVLDQCLVSYLTTWSLQFELAAPVVQESEAEPRH